MATKKKEPEEVRAMKGESPRVVKNQVPPKVTEDEILEVLKFFARREVVGDLAHKAEDLLKKWGKI